MEEKEAELRSNTKLQDFIKKYLMTNLNDKFNVKVCQTGSLPAGLHAQLLIKIKVAFIVYQRRQLS